MKAAPSFFKRSFAQWGRYYLRALNLLFLLALADPLRAGTYGPQQFNYSDGTTVLGDNSTIATSVTGVASVQGNALRLTQSGIASTLSSYKLPNVDPGRAIGVFDVTFTVRMSATGTPADGWSLNFGAIPAGNGGGDGGFAMANGMVIAWDTYDNTNDVPSIEIFCNGVSVANFPRTFVFDPAFRSVAIHWDLDGLDISYDGAVICSNLPTPGFTPASGNTFAFSARTGGATEDVYLDDLAIQTGQTPPVETGGPVISEFVAENKKGLEDEDVENPDWIEIYNGQNATVNLSGWHLTNATGDPALWTLPAITLSAYQYKIIYASGKNRTAVAGQLHTNFTLQKEGGYLALTRPDNTVATEYTYGPQADDISYGERGTARIVGFMQPPTPGAANTSAQAAGLPAEDIVFSREGGLITGPVTLSIAAPAGIGAVVRYTTNSTEPTSASAVYSAPFNIATNTTIRARIFEPNRLPGKVSSRSFLVLASTLTNYNGSGQSFSSPLPIIVLDSFGVPLDGYTDPAGRPFRPSYAVVIDKNPATGRASITDLPAFEGRSGVHVRGESSAGFQQRQYSWETWDESNGDKSVSLLGMPSESDWILYAPWSEKTLMRDHLIFNTIRKLRGDYMGVRTRLCEVFFNQTASTTVGYNTYRGVYLLKEKIKVDKDRVDISKVNALTTSPEMLGGGYIFRKDKPDPDSTPWNTASYGIPLQSYDPDILPAAQLAALRNSVNAFESALAGANFASPTLGYAAYIDPGTFIDAQWFVEWTKQVDGYVFSTYFNKDRGGKIRAGPIWDFNISLGNASYGTGEAPTGWLYDVANGVGQLWYPRLHQDLKYKLQHWDRYWEMRQGLLATSTVNAQIDSYANELLDGYTQPVGNNAPSTIQNPVARHYRKYQILGTVQWPNPNSATTRTTYQQEVDYMKTWLATRLGWIDDRYAVGTVVFRPPAFSEAGGNVPPNHELAITPYVGTPPTGQSYAIGEIYYTTNGADPRAPDGSIAGTLYSGPLTIATSTTVKARLRSGSTWSPLTAGNFIVDAVPATSANFIVTEIMYNPLGPTAAESAAGFNSASGFEFVELQNIGLANIDLSSVQVAGGISFSFSGGDAATLTLSPGERVILVANKAAFLMRYGTNPAVKIAGEYSGNLGNAGDQITLTGASGSVIRQFNYGDSEPWPADADGGGYSLVLNNPSTSTDLSLAANWHSSAQIGGSPGIPNGQPFTGSPNADTDGDGYPDYFEYATGSDMTSNSSFFAPQYRFETYTVNNVPGTYLTYEFRQNLAAEGVNCRVELSADLQTWQSDASAVTFVRTRNMGDGTALVTWRSAQPLDDAHPRMFMHLRVQP